MQKLILIDSGHGGLIEGNYVTSGKRAYLDNKFIYEGVLNRAVANLLQYKLSVYHIKSHIINPENEDVSLMARVRRVNALANKHECILLSIHHNAFRDPRAHGFECYTSRGETASDIYAELLVASFRKYNPLSKIKINTVNKKAKEANFNILINTKCPAILSEYAFMTNPEEFKYLITTGVENEVIVLLDWVKNILK